MSNQERGVRKIEFHVNRARLIRCQNESGIEIYVDWDRLTPRAAGRTLDLNLASRNGRPRCARKSGLRVCGNYQCDIALIRTDRENRSRVRTRRHGNCSQKFTELIELYQIDGWHGTSGREDIDGTAPTLRDK